MFKVNKELLHLINTVLANDEAKEPREVSSA